MKQVFIIGAGMSSSELIAYLIQNSQILNCHIRVGDISKEAAQEKIKNSSSADAISFNVNDENSRKHEIKKADIVISMLPAHMHNLVAKDCIRYKKDMVTASYVSDEIASLNLDAEKANVLLLNEIGLDPGIDHMSAMEVINDIQEEGGKILSFKSFTGGLVAAESDTNPWNYKFTWNPRNVVLAGQGVAQYIKHGRYKYIPYNKLFKRTETIEIPNFGAFEGYPNRDSLNYRTIYNLKGIPTILRGTLRRPGFCKAWDVFVQLGITDDSYILEDSKNMTYREFINSFLIYSQEKSVEEKLIDYLKIDKKDEVFQKIKWLGLLKNDVISLINASPAQILQKKLEEKWLLNKEDKDLVVMQHQFVYELNGTKKELHSSFGLEGKDNFHTAMSSTVGLPLGIATKLILQGEINLKGVRRPVQKEIYIPVLKELETLGIQFLKHVK